MIVMLDTSEDLRKCEAEVGYPVEHLFTPLTRFTNRHPDDYFAIDNGAFTRFDRKAFEALLARERERRHLCRFVTVPDVVGSARRTLEVFDYWFRELGGWPLAFAVQNGQEHLPIPWEHIEAIFIGGDNAFKDGVHVRHIVKAAKAMGKWVHCGRVNEAKRFASMVEMEVDSIDGSGIARFTEMREQLGRLVDRNKNQHNLFERPGIVSMT